MRTILELSLDPKPVCIHSCRSGDLKLRSLHPRGKEQKTLTENTTILFQIFNIKSLVNCHFWWITKMQIFCISSCVYSPCRAGHPWQLLPFLLSWPQQEWRGIQPQVLVPEGAVAVPAQAEAQAQLIRHKEQQGRAGQGRCLRASAFELPFFPKAPVVPGSVAGNDGDSFHCSCSTPHLTGSSLQFKSGHSASAQLWPLAAAPLPLRLFQQN